MKSRYFVFSDISQHKCIYKDIGDSKYIFGISVKGTTKHRFDKEELLECIESGEFKEITEEEIVLIL